MRLTDWSTFQITTAKKTTHLTLRMGGPLCGPNLDRGVGPTIYCRNAVLVTRNMIGLRRWGNGECAFTLGRNQDVLSQRCDDRRPLT